ncbi:RING/FYVE/PHD zinc finger protein [Quillaja saponaria]|uniref:RING/FYVE/PHD zinc finger protein n=1 Tax=Quillaja saponaria TaxID=32244 RepID=A0AAD7QHT7_QUISA|nr:RING/FYVE/PHD zinc finger protein [Quillaja saponaria]
MANGKDSEKFVVLSRVRTGLKREFAFALKVQSEICGSLGRTRASKNRNGVSESPGNKRLKSSSMEKTKNDANVAVKGQEVRITDGMGDVMSEEEAKSDVVDIISDDEPRNHVGESMVKREYEGETIMPVCEEELKSDVAGNVSDDEPKCSNIVDSSRGEILMDEMAQPICEDRPKEEEANKNDSEKSLTNENLKNVKGETALPAEEGTSGTSSVSIKVEASLYEKPLRQVY